MKKTIFATFVLIVIFACSSTKTQKVNSPNTEFANMTENFNESKLFGKWLTNLPLDSESYIVFNTDYTFITDSNRKGIYKIKKDSIFIDYSNYQAKGRLLKQTDDLLHILWGDIEDIKYIKPTINYISN